MNYFPDEVSIGFLEIPIEISLIIPLAGCGKACPSCHSPHHRTATNGVIFTEKELVSAIEKRKDKISCVCFFNGEANPEELISFLTIVKGYKLKTAFYSGRNSIEELDTNILPFLDYIKLGEYREADGPIDNKETNQKLFRVKDGELQEDITNLFWRNKE